MGKFFSGISFKKIISAAAALAMTISCVGTAFAEDSTSKVKVDVSYTDEGYLQYKWDFSAYDAKSNLTDDSTEASTFDAGRGLSFTKVSGTTDPVKARDTSTITVDDVTKTMDVYSKTCMVDSTKNSSGSTSALRYATFKAPYDGTFSFAIYGSNTGTNSKLRAYYTSSTDGNPAIPDKDSTTEAGKATTKITAYDTTDETRTNGKTISIPMEAGTTYNIALYNNTVNALTGMSDIKFVTTSAVTTHSEGFKFDTASDKVSSQSLTVTDSSGSVGTVDMSSILNGTNGTHITGSADLNLAIIFTNIPEGVSITSAVIE